LTDTGVTQARTTGHGLRHSFGAFDYAYHSGYRRTQETLEQVLAAYPDDERSRIQVRHNVFIRERDTGYTFDMTNAEVEVAFPWLQEYWDTSGPIFGQPPGGESLADVAKRVYLFLSMLFRDRAGRSVIVATHAGTIWMFRMLLERWSWEEAERQLRTGSIPQCSATAYAFDPDANDLTSRCVATIFWESATGS
jgi:broad specificity phosphatase PhoE